MNKYIDQLNINNKTDFLKQLYQIGLMNEVPIIGDDSLMTVLSIMKTKGVKEILEIGTAIGYSAISFVSDDETRHVDTIERDETMYNEAIKNIKQINYQDKINVIFNDANLVDTTSFAKKYDVIFIDAAKAQYQKFFEKYVPFLKDDGVVITDNILFHGCVEQVVFDDIDDATGNSFREILKNWATNGGQKMSDKSIINILLIGSDASTKESYRANATDKGNTDVMMLASIDVKNETIKLVSFMRDSYTYMDQFDRYAKLNAACANGGPAYLVETIENDYKIEIDGYVMVDFDSFVQVIDIVGGVRVNVPGYVGEHLNRGDCKNNHIPIGNNVLIDGEQALHFSRVRYTDADGDISRTRRQREVINALIEKCKGASLGEINAVADAVLANVRTNISQRTIISYAAKAVSDNWPSYTISQLTMPDQYTRCSYSSASTAWIWIVDYPLAAQTTQEFLYGRTNITLPENRQTAISIMGRTVPKKPTN